MENECTLFDQPVYPFEQKEKGKKTLNNKKGNFRRCKKIVAGVGSGILLGTFASVVSDKFVTDGQQVDEATSHLEDADLNLSHGVNTGAAYIDESSIDAAVDQLAEVVEPVEAAVENTGDPSDGAVAHPVPDGEIMVASQVNDNMSFNEAFSTARTEVGPGGAFEWRENLYATYTYEEWDQMDEGQRESFASHFDGSSEDDLLHSTAEYFAEGYADTVEDVAVLDADADVEVLGVVEDDDAIAVDGDDVYLVDVDNDLTADDYAQLQHNEADIENYDYTDEVVDPGMDNFDMP